ncbi:glycosyltransferase [Desulfospira joergensenii]|uniref:glycosyltransferase n=1 Tax=Desulfospira joergensenii TaxID=53329 RepID=UPI0003B6741F|nr:glycosyltransferase [Desulfospira joergensenii]
MRIFIATYGSRGDVQPYVALGKGLEDAGHRVTLATSERFREFVAANGLEYGYLGDGLLSIVDTDQGKDLLENTTNIFDVVKQNIKLAKQTQSLQKALLRETWEAAEKARPDFILYHPKAGAAPHIAEKLGIGCALATPIPMFVPTSERPFLALPDLKLGGWYNRLSYQIITSLTGIFLGKYIKEFRRDIGLGPLKKFNFLKTGTGQDIPVLHAYSEAVLPRPGDWPETAQVTGYWFLDGQTGWTPPQDLQAFLDKGEPPVYIGFGSMAGRNPDQLAETVITALQKSGLRGILATGWGGLKLETLPDTIFKIETAPHDWLFPRVSAVVHHGGAGTSGAGLRAGKPSVIVPFFGDQPFWGRCIHSLGAGSRPIPRKKLTADKLAAAIRNAVSNPDIREKAEEIGKKIRHEDGIKNGVAMIEKMQKA